MFVFDSENISFDAGLFIYINSTNIPPIMTINRIYEHQNLLSLYFVSFLVGLRTYQQPCTCFGQNYVLLFRFQKVFLVPNSPNIEHLKYTHQQFKSLGIKISHFYRPTNNEFMRTSWALSIYYNLHKNTFAMMCNSIE